MKIVEIKDNKLPSKLLAVLTATSIAVLSGCDTNVSSVEVPSSKEEVSSSTVEAPVYQMPSVESSTVEEIEEEEEQLPEPPEVEYSEWELGEWTTEVLEETDTCRLVNKTGKQETVYGAWSEWTTTPIEETDTRQVETTVKEGWVFDYYKEVPMYDNGGWEIPGQTTWVPVYKMENGYLITEEQVYYRSRDLVNVNSYTLYQYETREVTNQEELDDYEALTKEYENKNDTKKLTLTKE